MSGMWKDKSIEAGSLSAAAFRDILEAAGPIVVAIGLIFFATSTIFGWAITERNVSNTLFPNPKVLIYYRIVFIVQSSS